MYLENIIAIKCELLFLLVFAYETQWKKGVMFQIKGLFLSPEVGNGEPHLQIRIIY